MRTNLKTSPFEGMTHESAPARKIGPIDALRRSVMSCLLWEREFYEDGETIADRIAKLVAQVPPSAVASIAIEARSKMHLRHVPLYLTALLCKHASGTRLVSDTVPLVVRRADELAELLAIYQKINGKDAPIAAQLKKGLAASFANFDEYRFAKYDRDADVKLRDVMFLTHPNPGERADLFKRIADRTMKIPDTWEVELSAGADKRATFERLIREGKLGYLALLRNLRNMVDAGCDRGLIESAIIARKGADRVLPFRYVAAARAAPSFEPAIDRALIASIGETATLSGTTAVLVDVSRSMEAKLSEKSDLKRMDAASALASVIGGNVRMFSFSGSIVEVPARRGMAGIDALNHSQPHGGTLLFDAVAQINKDIAYDRLIVITDEQADGTAYARQMIQGTLKTMPPPKDIGYVINVASAKNGVGYGPWVHIDGFSEQVIRFITEHERAAAF